MRCASLLPALLVAARAESAAAAPVPTPGGGACRASDGACLAAGAGEAAGYAGEADPGTPHVLIVGATGIVGRAAVQLFDSQGPRWRVTAVSRRALDFPTASVRHVSVDLTDAVASEAAFSQMHDVTHVVYAALYEKEDVFWGWLDDEQMRTNDRMLRNVLGPLVAAAAALRSVQLMQGAKAYGTHTGQVLAPLPYKERDPRVEHRNFYWLQEDFLRERQRESGGAWHYTIWRPPFILGYATKSNLNVLTAVAVHAALMRELGRPLAFPGMPIPMLTQLVDARLLARATLWAAAAPAAANQTFNIHNGDSVVWKGLYPRIASLFGMPTARPRVAYTDEMLAPAYEATWAGMVRKYGLQNRSIAEVVGPSFQMANLALLLPPMRSAIGRAAVSWAYWLAGLVGAVLGDAFLLATPPMSMVKLRQAGFTASVDTEDCIVEWLREMQQLRIIPP